MAGKIGSEPDREDRDDKTPGSSAEPSRRDALGMALNTGVALSLGASYGVLGGYAVTYLYPTQQQQKAWLFVSQVSAIASGGQLKFQAPSGAAIAVARIAEGSGAESFIALSSTCPHMGCQVYWESAKQRFFCPCHNGVFNAHGEGIEGPPKGQNLAHYPVKVENGLLFIEVPTESLPSERKRMASAASCGCDKRKLPVLQNEPPCQTEDDHGQA